MKKLFILILFFALFVSPVLAESVDSDSDGLDDGREIIYGTDINNPDTDKDGYQDGQEVDAGYSPLFGKKKKMIEADFDKDGLNDYWEILLGTDLKNQDSDGDGLKDGQAVNQGFDPLSKKTIRPAKEIKVSIDKQKLTYTFGGVVLDTFLVSTGVPGMGTPKGTYKILQKKPTVNYGGAGFNYSYPNTKWNLKFLTQKYSFFIHGAYWHNNFGKKMSHGCVNVSYVNMEKLYNWAEVGTNLVIN